MANNVRKDSVEVSGWVGWVYFAGFMMLIMGILQMISGFTALLNDKFYAVGPDKLVALDFTTWGWVHLFLGLIVTIAGSAVLSGQAWGRVVAVILAILSVIANFAFIDAYPLWSIIVIVIDILIIYALTVHGAETELDTV